MDSETDSKEVILFADDSRTARAAAVKVLQEKYSVIEAEDGDSAWQLINAHPEIDLVFADIHMPTANGFELLNNIRQSSDSRISNLPVIIITGVENSEAAMRAALKIGATDFISKPFKGIDMLCRTHSYISLNRKIRFLESQNADTEEASPESQYLTPDPTVTSGSERYDFYARKSLSFANRHRTSCSFAMIEIGVLNEIADEHDTRILDKVRKIIYDKLDGHLREEDLFVQREINRFGLILPATGQVKSQVLLLRFVKSISAMELDIKSKKYRLTANAAVYSCRGSDNNQQRIDEELEQAIIRSKQGKSNIVICEDVVEADKDTSDKVDESALADSLLHILDGEYQKVVDVHIKELTDRLGPFLQYANNRST